MNWKWQEWIESDKNEEWIESDKNEEWIESDKTEEWIESDENEKWIESDEIFRKQTKITISISWKHAKVSAYDSQQLNEWIIDDQKYDQMK